jgi:hypothetical protein
MEEDNMGGARSTHGVVVNAYEIFVGKPKRKRPPERSRRRWEDIL